MLLATSDMTFCVETLCLMDLFIHSLIHSREGGLERGGSLVLNSQASPPTFCSDAAHTSWIDMSAASPPMIANVVEWAAWEDVEFFFDHRLIVTQLFHHPTKTTVHTTWDLS